MAARNSKTLSRELTLLATWHPAGMMRARAKTARSFLIHLKKACKVARGIPRDRAPKIILNPPSKVARSYFEKWHSFAVDVETPSVASRKLLSVAVAGSANEALVWDPTSREAQLGPLYAALASTKMKVFQNGEFDIDVLQNNGASVNCGTRDDPYVWDTMIEQQCRFPDEPASLTYLASIHLDVEAWKHESGEDLYRYNGYDAVHTIRIFKAYDDEDDYVWKRMHVLWDLIMPLNKRGITLDTHKRNELRKHRVYSLASWTRRATKAFKAEGYVVPIGPKGGVSSQKARDILYDQMGLPTKYDPKTQQPTVGKKALRKLREHDESGLVELLLERSDLKDAEVPLKSRESKDGRMRTRFIFGGDEKSDQNETGKTSPASGRLASRRVSPTEGTNLQNWKEWIRCILRAERGKRLIKADYSQIELRLIGEFSKDRELLKALEGDAHLYITHLIDRATGLYGFGKNWEELVHRFESGDKKVRFARDEMKRIVYGWCYRMGARKMEEVKDVPRQRGRLALDGLNETFSGIVRWWNSLAEEVAARAEGSGWGWLTNAWGRKRYFFSDDAPAFCNFLPQSSAADILFDAMLAIEEELPKQMLLTCHDEVVLESLESEVLEDARHVKEIMERPIEELDGFVVPVEVMIGINWAKASESNPNGCVKVPL